MEVRRPGDDQSRFFLMQVRYQLPKLTSLYFKHTSKCLALRKPTAQPFPIIRV